MFINRKTLFELSKLENISDYSDFNDNEFVHKIVENLMQNFDRKNAELYNVVYNEIIFELYEMSSNIEEYDEEEIELYY